MKKAVLIASANDFAGNLNVARFTTLLAPPLSTLALGSYLAAHGVPVELIDVQMDFGFGLTRAAEQAVGQRVVRYLCDQADRIGWIGISEISNSGNGILLAQEIHTALPDMPIVVGGYFPSGSYRLLLEKYPFITAVVRGDGEAAALQISRSLAAGQSFLSRQTPNLAWLSEGEIHTTPTKPVDLNDLPILDFRLLRNKSSYQVVDLITSRGCPYQCNYCLERNMRPYATHSPAWVAQQLAHLEAEMPNERVFIYDPIFGVNKQRALELCRIMRGRRFTYAVESRADILTPDLVHALHETGVEAIFLGIESGSARTLLRMNKVRSAVSAGNYLRDAIDILKVCFESGVTPVVGFMVGFPGDTESDYETTLKFVMEISHLHDEVTARTGVAVGFVPFAFYTKIYDGSSLAECVARDFPEAVLRSEPFDGERTVIAPSPGLDLRTSQRYQTEIARHGVYAPLALERLSRYFSFSMEAFLTAHPELTDEQDVTMLGDGLQRFPQEFNIASTLYRFDKSKS